MTSRHQSKTQNSIISFGYVDSYAKLFLILYPKLENSTTRIAKVVMHPLGPNTDLPTLNKLQGCSPIFYESSPCKKNQMENLLVGVALLLVSFPAHLAPRYIWAKNWATLMVGQLISNENFLSSNLPNNIIKCPYIFILPILG